MGEPRDTAHHGSDATCVPDRDKVLATQPEENNPSTQCPSPNLRGNIHPIQRSPPDILERIFFFCIPTHNPAIDSAPLLLTRVCGTWRQTATKSHQLWTIFSDHVLNPCHFLPLWLSNAGSLPISLFLSRIRWPAAWNQKEALEIVINNLHRFKHLTADFNSLAFQEELNRHALPINAPLLFSWTHRGNASGIMTPPPNLKGSIYAPNLRRVTVHDLAALEVVSFNPASLRDLTINTPYEPTDIPSFQFLTLCSNITFLTIRFDEGTLSIEGEFVFPRLASIELHYFSDNYACQLLDSMHAPVLQRLAACVAGDGEICLDSPGLMPALHSFVDRNAPPLQELTLGMLWNIDAEQFNSLLRKLRGLRTLSLHHSAVDDDILRALTHDESTPSDSWLCPELTTLDLSYSDLNWEVLIDMIKSRAPINTDQSTSRVFLSRVFARTNPEVTDREDVHTGALRDIVSQCNGRLRIEY